MDGYSISQVAERTGFPSTTLRFYEQSGLVRPGRTAAGYRCYDDADVERLSFIGRAKGFGLTLDEITELLVLLGDDECRAPVQGRLRQLVDAKIADARATVVDLTAFTVELERVAASLDAPTPDGPCDDSCGCTTDHAAEVDRPVALGRRSSSDPPIACSLSGEQVADRIAEWQVTVAGATRREVIADGTRLRFESGVDVAALAALVAAEQRCCSFFTFTLTVGPDEVALEVSAPADARPMIDALIGTA